MKRHFTEQYCFSGKSAVVYGSFVSSPQREHLIIITPSYGLQTALPTFLVETCNLVAYVPTRKPIPVQLWLINTWSVPWIPSNKVLESSKSLTGIFFGQ